MAISLPTRWRPLRGLRAVARRPRSPVSRRSRCTCVARGSDHRRKPRFGLRFLFAPQGSEATRLRPAVRREGCVVQPATRFVERTFLLGWRADSGSLAHRPRYRGGPENESGIDSGDPRRRNAARATSTATYRLRQVGSSSMTYRFTLSRFAIPHRPAITRATRPRAITPERSRPRFSLTSVELMAAS